MTSVFVASNIPHDYPLKLQKPATATPTVRNSAETYILDSGIGDETTNAEVLNLATKLEADYVVPCDELHDQEATTEAVREFADLYADHECTATPLIPLQPPHAEHYLDLPDWSHYALGGMALESVTDKQAIQWARDCRAVAGPDVHLHGLGIGGGQHVINTLSGEGVFNTVDCATPELAAQHGCVLDGNLRHTNMLIHSGEGFRRRVTPLAEVNSWQIQDAWAHDRTDEQQTTLEELTHD